MYYSNLDVVVVTIDYDVVPTTNNKYAVEKVYRWTIFFMLMQLSMTMSIKVVIEPTSMFKTWLNALNEWRKFGVMIERLIIDLFKDESFVMALIDMLSMFVPQVVKKTNNLYLPTK